jgi:hypothetical protein
MSICRTSQVSSSSLFDMLNNLKSCTTIFRRTEMQSFLNVFDHILKQYVYPARQFNTSEHLFQHDEQLSTMDHLLKLSQYGINALKIVQIEKQEQPLGLTISRADTGSIHIARILVGGIASTSELFQINDRILEINDQPMTGHSLNDICSLMSNTNGLIKFLLAPSIEKYSMSYQAFFVRALFSYDPLQDPLMPCPELAMAFQHGDILRIVAYNEYGTDNTNTLIGWWQAFREDQLDSTTNNMSLAGLIPSDSLQVKRTYLLKALSDDNQSISSSSLMYPSRRTKMTRTCLTCVSTKHQRQPLPSMYNNASFMIDLDKRNTALLRQPIHHVSSNDSQQLTEEILSTIEQPIMKMQHNRSIDSFRFYERVMRFTDITKQILRPIVLLGKSSVISLMV